MTNDNDGWIDGNVRLPTNAELPCWMARDGLVLFLTALHFSDAHDCFWKPAEVPTPPKLGPTQEEMDNDAAIAWMEERIMFPAPLTAWHAALAWEREHVRKILEGDGAIRCVLSQPDRRDDPLARRIGLRV